MKVTFEPLIIMFSHALFLWWLRVALWTSQVRTGRESKKKHLLWTRSVMLSMLLTTHCVTRHVIWNYGLKELTFNLDATILHRKLSVLYLLTWCWVTSRLNQPREGISYLTSSHRPTKNVLVLITAALIKTTDINYYNNCIFYDNSGQIYLVKNFPSS